MHDKQIIIDGIDVSGCSYGEIEKDVFKCSCEYNVRSASMFCKDNPNCYYKQLKRKEQECWDLRSVRDSWMSKCEQEMKTSEFFQDRFEDLKRTLTEIKEILEIHKDNKCAICSKFDECFEHPSCDNIILQKISEVIDE